MKMISWLEISLRKHFSLETTMIGSDTSSSTINWIKLEFKLLFDKCLPSFPTIELHSRRGTKASDILGDS